MYASDRDRLGCVHRIGNGSNGYTVVAFAHLISAPVSKRVRARHGAGDARVPIVQFSLQNRMKYTCTGKVEVHSRAQMGCKHYLAKHSPGIIECNRVGYSDARGGMEARARASNCSIRKPEALMVGGAAARIRQSNVLLNSRRPRGRWPEVGNRSTCTCSGAGSFLGLWRSAVYSYSSVSPSSVQYICFTFICFTLDCCRTYI